MRLVFHRVENIVEKEENAGTQRISPFLTMSSKGIFIRVGKSHLCGKSVNLSYQARKYCDVEIMLVLCNFPKFSTVVSL